jgi:hypothetical protein
MPSVVAVPLGIVGDHRVLSTPSRTFVKRLCKKSAYLTKLLRLAHTKEMTTALIAVMSPNNRRHIFETVDGKISVVQVTKS